MAFTVIPYGPHSRAAERVNAWIAPFADLGVNTLTPLPTGGTDHMSFDRVGLPGFQFIQDQMDYESRTHHTNLDTYDHLSSQDLRQAAVVLAAMLFDAADRDELLPRNVLPTQPKEADPFVARAPEGN